MSEMLFAPRVSAGLRVVLLVLGAAACGGSNAASQLAKAPEYTPENQSKCAVRASQSEPLIVE